MTKTMTLENRIYLHQFLVQRFNLTELKDMAFYLGIDYDLFENKTISDFAREMVLYFERRGRERCLIQEIIKQRPDYSQTLHPLLVSLPPCQALTKVQIVLAESVITDRVALMIALAKAFDIQEQEITLIAAAWGSTHLLLQIPISAINFAKFDRTFSLNKGQYHVLSIEDFTFLALVTQDTWQFVATEHPPFSQGKAMYPTVSWIETKESISRKQAISKTPPRITTNVPNHWLANELNQETIYSLSLKIVDKLVPGDTKQLETIFPRYIELAQKGRVQTARQAAQAFGLGDGTESLVLVVISVLVTAFNAWLGQKNRQILTEIKEQKDWESLNKLFEDKLKENPVSLHWLGRIRSALDEVVPMELGDVYTPYEQGLRQLHNKVGINLELLTYTQRLQENIRKVRRYGDTEDLRTERNGIIEQLNVFALSLLDKSFNDLCT